MCLATFCLLVFAMCNVRLTLGDRLVTSLAPRIARSTEERPVVPRIQVFARCAKTTSGLDLNAIIVAVKDVWMADASQHMENVSMVANQAFGVLSVMKLALKRPWEHVIARQVCQRSAKKAAIQG
jgi:hypothetical protein